MFINTSFRLLAIGRLDAVVHTELSGRYIIESNDYQANIKVNSTPFHYADVYIASGKNTFLSLLKQFDQQINKPEPKLKVQALIDTYRY